MKTTGSRWINTLPDRNEGKLLLSYYDPKKNPLNGTPLKNNHYHVNKSGGVLIHLQYKRKKVRNMTDKGKELMKETVENLKKLDKESMMLVKASIDILIARQKKDEKNPTNAA